jgi:hypothetical protein
METTGPLIFIHSEGNFDQNEPDLYCTKSVSSRTDLTRLFSYILLVNLIIRPLVTKVITLQVSLSKLFF